MIITDIDLPNRFNKRLIAWSEQVDRPLPWRQEPDPYRIWLSEILLQQTRAETVVAYYNRFLEAFPSVQELSIAPIETVLKLWEGLGYYNRARNLHKTAGIVHTEYGGQFPETYEGLLSLPGIGPYTAAAIASFAFGRPHAVVDGNVIRVISRLTALQEPVDHPATRGILQQWADQLMGKSDPAIYNQAIMDFGALQCIPKNPDCARCPFSPDCTAYVLDLVSTLPLKRKKAPVTDRSFVFFIFYQQDTTWLTQRGDQDIWPQLYTFPFVEVSDISHRKRKPLLREQVHTWTGMNPQITLPQVPDLNQLLSHQRIHGFFLPILLPQDATIPVDWIAAQNGDFSTWALPRIIRTYIETIGLPH